MMPRLVWDDAEARLRQADLDVRGGDAKIADESQLEASPEGDSVERGDDRLG
jgi:hypothetical protein